MDTGISEYKTVMVFCFFEKEEERDEVLPYWKYVVKTSSEVMISELLRSLRITEDVPYR